MKISPNFWVLGFSGCFVSDAGCKFMARGAISVAVFQEVLFSVGLSEFLWVPGCGLSSEFPWSQDFRGLKISVATRFVFRISVVSNFRGLEFPWSQNFRGLEFSLVSYGCKFRPASGQDVLF